MTRTALVVLALVASSGCRRHVLPTTTITVGTQRVLVEVADDGQERSRGLMFRDSLPSSEGMLFVYPEAKERSFWMKNVRFPLSIAFMDSSGTIVSVSDMKPMSSRSTPSGAPAMYALEMNDGWFEEHGIAVGTVVTGLPEPSEH